MPNTNVLADYRCPKCGYDEYFRVWLKGWFYGEVNDDGYAYSDLQLMGDEWEDMECPDCKFVARHERFFKPEEVIDE